jgi:hypothetical protein
MLVDRYHPSLDAVLETLQPFIDEGAMAGLCTIVADIEQRIARMRSARLAPNAIDRGSRGGV